MSARHPLLDVLREDRGPTAQEIAHLSDRVGRSLSLSLPPPAVPTAGGAALTKSILGLFALVVTGSAIGVGVMLSRSSAEPSTPAPSVTIVAPAEPAPLVEPAAAIETNAIEAKAPEAKPTPPPVSPTEEPPPSFDANRRAERALVQNARAKLLAGDATGALHSLQEHQRRFPSGTLQEEREALFVMALAADNQEAAAHARRQRFERRWPASLFGSAVRAAAP